MEGEALFVPTGRGLRCEEAGTLVYGGVTVEARRVYLWRAVPGGVAVDYEDGRSFHRFSFAAAKAEHICTPDLYRVAYDFSTWPHWRAEWHVTGPRKDYTSLTRYHRLA